ncbi:hypothetical protein [Acidovorax sp.]|uniref:hypothetical protein n=1 Tax=Acidovorax sp. TaxID=1872122 RepID=UPI002ACE85F5|nr:hypothetical protein [Acidovorax sp.]MDZ7863022.1 hypothetical protein [Acidovorax sp.]
MAPLLITHTAAAVLGAALAATAAWQVQGWRLGGQITSLQASHASERARASQAAWAAERATAIRYQGALNVARTREAALQRDAARARALSDGLREQAAHAARRIADGAAPAAVAEYATAVGELFADCSRAHQELARQADGHAADARALRDAWPLSTGGS